eukprot:UN03847
MELYVYCYSGCMLSCHEDEGSNAVCQEEKCSDCYWCESREYLTPTTSGYR